jgi:glutamate racemase
MKNKKIGFFDSGVGGLSVLQHFLPYDIECVYVADTAHIPYGNKSIEQLQERCKESVQVFVRQDIDIVVIACNTAVIALPYLQKIYPTINFVQAVDYTIALASQSNCPKIGVFATKSVIDTGLYTKKLEKLGIQVVPIACPMLASSIEQGNEDDVLEQVRYYSTLMQQAHVQGVVLACTHYHAVTHLFKQYLPNIKVITSDGHKDLVALEYIPGKARVTYYVSGDKEIFKKVALNIIGSLHGSVNSF